jgi:hypothetical protein
MLFPKKLAFFALIGLTKVVVSTPVEPRRADQSVFIDFIISCCYSVSSVADKLFPSGKSPAF